MKDENSNFFKNQKSQTSRLEGNASPRLLLEESLSAAKFSVSCTLEAPPPTTCTKFPITAPSFDELTNRISYLSWNDHI